MLFCNFVHPILFTHIYLYLYNTDTYVSIYICIFIGNKPCLHQNFLALEPLTCKIHRWSIRFKNVLQGRWDLHGRGVPCQRTPKAPAPEWVKGEKWGFLQSYRASRFFYMFFAGSVDFVVDFFWEEAWKISILLIFFWK